jgi:divalent metal cation (Fe/Co/Zn/Cd) transporter
MFIVWEGLGCVVIPIIIGGVALAAAIAEAQPNQKWPRLFAVGVTALCIAVVGLVFNRRQPVARDNWGNALTAKQNHTLYWIPIEYWAVIVAIIGTILVYRK